MKNKILIQLLLYLINRSIALLTPELLREFADKVLDFVEKRVAASVNTFDDALLPICNTIRETFNIPDND